MVARKLTFISVVLLSLAQIALADPLNGSLELGTSVSQSYQARDVFSNPAALAFESELNDPGLLSSFTYGLDKTRSDEFSFGLTFGYLGFGFEQLAFDSGTYNRYSFMGAVPLTSQLYLGTRFSTTGSDSTAFSGIHSWDLGLQYRAFSFLSVGVLGNKLNEPTVAGAKQPAQLVAGVTVRPIDRLDISFDVDTNSDHFGKQYGYQGTGSFEVLPGLKISAGYHSDYKFLAGLQFALGHAEAYTTVQPSTSTERRLVAGFDSTLLPSKSFLKPQTAIKVVSDPNLSEEGTKGGLFSKQHPSLLEILETLKAAEKDPKVKVIAVKIETFPMGLSAAQELTEELLRLREAGKQIDVFIGNAGTKEYLIASAASHIHMEASGELRFLGPRSERFYAKGTLDKLGVEPEFLAKGEFKSAPEMFTRKESSSPSKEATLHELKSMEQGIVDVLSKTRKNSADYKKLAGHGLYSAQEALDAKLIDSVDRYSDEIEKIGHSYYVQDSIRENNNRLSLPPLVAVIIADGDIMERKVRALSLAGTTQVTPEKMGKLFKAAADDSRIKAIVFRVTSPGGEILASHEIASMVESAKAKKPVIVSMGDVAASGGYMVSAPADKIFAESLSVTGSVGVFLGKFSLENLYKKIDLRKEIISEAPYAGILSEGRPWSGEEKALMLKRLDQYYDGFVTFVSKNRKIKKEEAETAAKGRAWLGVDAKRLKLIDELGGYREAINEAANRAGIAKDFETVEITTSGGLLSFLDEDSLMIKDSPLTGLPFALFSPKAIKELHWMLSLNENPFLYWAPASEIE